MCQAEKNKRWGVFLHLKIPAKNVENIWFPFGSFALEKLRQDMGEACQHHTERLIKTFTNQFQIAIKKGQQDSLPFGCLLWLKAWMSMGEKMLECISRRSSPEYLLQAKIECVFQSVQYKVSPNSVKAKGCGREPLTTACLTEHREKMNAQTQFM